MKRIFISSVQKEFAQERAALADRLEIWNPGSLPSTLNLQALRQPHGSYPANPLVAEPLYLAKYIERMGTGTGDMIDRCKAHGLPEPSFALTDGFVTTIWRKPELALSNLTPQVTPQVTPEVRVLLALQNGELSRQELQRALNLKDAKHLRKNYILPALHAGLIAMTLPDKPQSSNQTYQLTAKGRRLLKGQN